MIFRPFFVSLYTTLRVFLVDYDYQDLIGATGNLASPLHEIFGLYFSVLYVIAPIMTLTNVLSLFKNLMGNLKLRFLSSRPLYIFSELNQMSLTMAKSIAKGYRESRKHSKPLIVFTDIVDPKGEQDYELMKSAAAFHAVFLKEDITQVNVKSKKLTFSPRHVEYFIIGENESECIEQATRLTEKNKNYKNRIIYLFSSKPVAGYILDSTDKGACLFSESLLKQVESDPKGFLENKAAVTDTGDCFRCTRVNTLEQLSIDVLSSSKLFKKLYSKAKEKKEISLLIVGAGKYGLAFLKTALWMYQICGFKLKIRVIDKAGTYSLRRRIENDIPALAEYRLPEDGLHTLHYKCGVENLCDFEIFIHSGIDCRTSDVQTFVCDPVLKDQLALVQMAFVTLGSDDDNIETSIKLKRYCERIAAEPMIYAVVYDDRKAAELKTIYDKSGKNQYFNINIIGKISKRFNYKTIESLKKEELEGLRHHFDWIRSTHVLHMAYEEACREPAGRYGKLKEAIDADNGGKAPEKWYDEHMYLPDGSLGIDSIKEEIKRYAEYEYYRNSSIAKGIHSRLMDTYCEEHFSAFDAEHEHYADGLCTCPRCTKRRISEHMRWSAFMYTQGYQFGKRDDIARLHPDLTAWDKLPVSEQFKD